MPYLRRNTKNLIIRPLAEKDYKVWKACYLSMKESQNIWDVSRRTKSQLTKNEFRYLLKSREKMRNDDAFYSLSVFEKKTGAIVGGVSAMDVVRSVTQMAFLGYWLHNNFWGRGYGKESVLAMVDIAFKDIKLHRIEAGIEPNNRRSIMMARSIGLRKEGLKKRAVYLRGQWQDLVMYSATCEEFGIKWRGKTKKNSR